MGTVFTKKLFILLIVTSLLFLSSTYAGAFKCVDKKGNTIFQDSACASGKKETKIELESSRNVSTPVNQCTESCQSDNQLCLADLAKEDKVAKNLSVCEEAKLVCFDSCTDSDIEVLDTMENSAYDRELRHKRSLEREARYQKFWVERDEAREQKRKNRSCKKYKKKLAKIKAQWERKQRAGWKPKDEEKYRIKIENAKDAVKIECPQ